MVRAVIVTSDSDADLAIRSHLIDIEEEEHTQGTVYTIGKFPANEQTWEVAIADIDNNSASASIETERAINHFKPDAIVLIGVATGLKDVALGDIVVATKVYGYESGKAEAKFTAHPDLGKPSYRLQERAKAESKKEDWHKRLNSGTSSPYPKIFLAPIASGDKEIVDPKADILPFLRSQYGDAVAVENLGFGFLKTASANNQVLALTLHGISSLINTNPETIQKDWRSSAIRNASAFAFEVLAKYKTGNTASTKRVEGIRICEPTLNELFAGTGQRFEAAVSNESNSLTNERHQRIDHARNLIERGQFSQAVQYLEDLKAELWYQADNILKYRLLANLGMANLGLDEINDGAAKLLEALQYNPEDDKAIAFAAMGYTFQKDFANAEKLIEKALEKNPANELAYSLRIGSAPITESIESILDRIPAAYHQTLDVLIALGEAALKRDRRDLAEKYWNLALEKDTSNKLNGVKVALGTTLMEPIAQEYPLIAAGQLLNSQKQCLERAIVLFNEVLEGDYVNPNDLSHLKSTALINRAGAWQLLSQYDKAIRDIDIAIQKEPDNPYLIKQRALLAHEKGNEAEAYSYAQQILSYPETPEASLLAANSLMSLDRLEEAEDLLNGFLLADSPKDLKQHAKCLKFDLCLKRGDRQGAEEILEQMSQEDPENIFTLISHIRWQKYLDSEEKIPELIERAKATLVSQSFTPGFLALADCLSSFHYYRDAAEVYEQFVDASVNSSLCQKLVYAHYFAGNYKDALNLCQQLLNKYGSLPTISEIAAYIYGDIGDMNAARQICEDYLNVFPGDAAMQLRLAAVNYDTEEYEQLDRFLDSKPSIEGLSLAALKKLAQLYKVRNRIDRFLETIYEIRHRFYDDGQVHAFYQISYLEVLDTSTAIQTFQTVQDGCGVLLKNQFDREEWYILEERQDAVADRNELNRDRPLYQKLIGKRVGDEIVIAEDNFGRNTIKIIAITDKYCAAGKQSFTVLENCPDIKNFRMVRVPTDGENVSSDLVKQLIEGGQKFKDSFDSLKAEYVSGKIPLGAISVLLNRDPVAIWHNLSGGVKPCIHAWSNFQNEKFEDALVNLQKGGLVVADPLSIIAIHYLNVADDVVSILGKLGIAQSTIELLQAMVETTRDWETRGLRTFGVENGQGILHEFTPEQVAPYKDFWEKIFNWARNNCLVLPCNKALDINREQRRKIEDLVGSVFIDTLLIASEPGRILYSDDQWLRWYANCDSGVRGVWTQAVLKYCLLQQSTNEPLYRKATLELALRGYSYTIIEAGMLMEAVRLAAWQVNPIYTSALRALGDRNTDPNHIVSTSADFLYHLYLEVIVTDTQCLDPRDLLVFELLKILTAQRSATYFTRQLKQAIQHKFKLMPIQKRDAIAAIDAWFSSLTVIT